MSQQNLLNAPIKYTAHYKVSTGFIDLFSFETCDGPTLFEVDYNFLENGNDFWVDIANFGLKSQAAASSRNPALQKPFSATEVSAIRKRIVDFFSGDEEKKFPPFILFDEHWKEHFQGVRFTSGWVVEV